MRVGIVSKAIACLSLVVSLGCGGGEVASPEAQVRALLETVEAAVEAGDLDTVRDAISEHYEDERGQDKKALVRYLTFHVLRNSNRHVLSRVRSVEVDASFAVVRLHAGLASTPLENPDDWSGIRASIYAMDLQFAEEEEGVWRLVTALWRRATPTELL